MNLNPVRFSVLFFGAFIFLALWISKPDYFLPSLISLIVAIVITIKMSKRMSSIYDVGDDYGKTDKL